MLIIPKSSVAVSEGDHDGDALDVDEEGANSLGLALSLDDPTLIPKGIVAQQVSALNLFAAAHQQSKDSCPNG